MKVGEGIEEDENRLLQALAPGALSGKRNVFDKVCGYEFIDRREVLPVITSSANRCINCLFSWDMVLICDGCAVFSNPQPSCGERHPTGMNVLITGAPVHSAVNSSPHKGAAVMRCASTADAPSARFPARL